MTMAPPTTRSPGSYATPPRGLFAAVRAGIGAFATTFFGPNNPPDANAGTQAEGPRQFQYVPGYNLRLQPRAAEGLTDFAWLINIADLYDTVRQCIRYRVEEMQALDWEIVPRDPHITVSDAQLTEARNRVQFPDGRMDFETFMAMVVEESLVTDALTIDVQTNRRGDVTSLHPIDGALWRPLADAHGRIPSPPTPAYQQWVYGQTTFSAIQMLTSAELKADRSLLAEYGEVLYLPKNVRTRSLYGRSPTEELVITINRALRRQMFDLSYYCYDDQTEILTREGWRRFGALSGDEEFATRSPGGTFEWQRATLPVNDQSFDGELLHFRNRAVDLMVTPNHRMLTRRKWSGRIAEQREPWHIERADSFLGKPHRAREYELPAISAIGDCEETHQVPAPTAVPYSGRVYCVTVPNGIVYVRRNGKAIWCGNTEGNIPEAIAGVPDFSSEQVEELQNWFDSIVAQQPSKRRRIMFLPSKGDSGIDYHEFKAPISDPVVEEHLDQRTMAHFGLTKQELGFTDDANRSTSEGQENVQMRRRLPYMRFYSRMWTRLLDRMGYPDCAFRYLAESPEEDKLAQAQADDIYVRMGKVSVDELRERDGEKALGVAHYFATATGPVPLLSGMQAADAENMDTAPAGAANPAPPPQLMAPAAGVGDEEEQSAGAGGDDAAVEDEPNEGPEDVSRAADEVRAWRKWATRRFDAGADGRFEVRRAFRFSALPAAHVERLNRALAGAMSREDIAAAARWVNGHLGEIKRADAPPAPDDSEGD